MRHRTTLKTQESGMVSILVVMVMCVVISVVTVGFVKIMIRENREALDNQLTTQAFYAASSGVNDARIVLQLNPSFTPDTFCRSQDSAPTFRPTSTLTTVPIDYPCQLIDKDVYNILFLGDPTQGRTFPLQTQSEKTDTIHLEWESSEDAAALTGPAPPADFSLPNNILSGGIATGHAALRVTIINASEIDGSGLSRAQLTNNARNFIVKPSSDGTDVITYEGSGGANDGNIYNAKCDPISATRPYQCKIDIVRGGGRQFDTRAEKLYIRVRPIYNAAHISISGCEKVGGGTCTPQLLRNAQYTVDVTGRSNDVYRRLSVRLNQDSNRLVPDFDIESANICKQVEVSDVLEKTACGAVVP